MRSRLAQTVVFVCVFCLFVCYCKWWNARQEPVVRVNAQPPPDCGAYAVRDAADETFNGIYVPLLAYNDRPCFAKEAPPRFLWQDDVGWHLSTEPGMLADGYITEPEEPVDGHWAVDGGLEPAPKVTLVMVAEAEG